MNKRAPDFLRSREEREDGHTHLTKMGWADIPHLTDKAKRDLYLSTPPYLRGARMNGEPVTGRGRIYPIDAEQITIEPFRIPEVWARCYGFDPGVERTAGIWGAHNRDEDILYLYSEYYRGQTKPRDHVAAIQSRGKWVPGVIDPSAAAGNQADGRSYMDIYTRLGLLLYKANNAVEAGLIECYDRMMAGQLKVFRTLVNFIYEFNMYQRDKNQRVARKQPDHLMDAMRYLVMSGLTVARPKLLSEGAYLNLPSGVADQKAGY